MNNQLFVCTVPRALIFIPGFRLLKLVLFVLGFDYLPVVTWIDLIPQLVASIDCKEPVRRCISALLLDLGKIHPQAILTPLMVATKHAILPGHGDTGG